MNDRVEFWGEDEDASERPEALAVARTADSVGADDIVACANCVGECKVY